MLFRWRGAGQRACFHRTWEFVQVAASGVGCYRHFGEAQLGHLLLTSPPLHLTFSAAGIRAGNAGQYCQIRSSGIVHGASFVDSALLTTEIPLCFAWTDSIGADMTNPPPQRERTS
jgi:hypothetical protein